MANIVKNTYVEADVEQAKDLYTQRGFTNVSQLSRVTGIPYTTLKTWCERGDWDKEVKTGKPIDMAFLHHMVKMVLSNELLELHDASIACDDKRINDKTFVIRQLFQSLKLASESMEDTKDITLENAVRTFENAIKQDKSVTEHDREVFMSILTLLHIKIIDKPNDES